MRVYCCLLLLLASACVPREQIFSPASDYTPVLLNDAFYPAEETRLPYRSWLPKGKPQAVILALHGFNDYSNAYIGAGTFFKEHGVAVYAYDQRGFGSAPERGIWAGEKNLVGDLKRYVEALAKKYPRTPIYILGESMGGAVAISALSDPAFPHVNGVILVAPALWGAETMNPIFRSTLWLAAHTVPYHEMTGEHLKILASNNVPMLRRLGADPLVIKRTRVDAIYGVVQLMGSAYEKIPQVKTPTLLLYGSEDQVIPKAPIESGLMRFTRAVQFAYYDGGYHMLLRDIQGEMVLRDILSWIKHPAAPLPSGYGGTYSGMQR